MKKHVKINGIIFKDYLVDKFGNVYNLSGLKMKQQLTHDGYTGGFVWEYK